MLQRFIKAMDAASRRLEAEAALIRAKTSSRSALYRAFMAGSRAGIAAYSAAQCELDAEKAWRRIDAESDTYLTAALRQSPSVEEVAEVIGDVPATMTEEVRDRLSAGAIQRIAQAIARLYEGRGVHSAFGSIPTEPVGKGEDNHRRVE